MALPAGVVVVVTTRAKVLDCMCRYGSRSGRMVTSWEDGGMILAEACVSTGYSRGIVVCVDS
jgi:hypothetical protein